MAFIEIDLIDYIDEFDSEDLISELERRSDAIPLNDADIDKIAVVISRGESSELKALIIELIYEKTGRIL